LNEPRSARFLLDLPELISMRRKWVKLSEPTGNGNGLKGGISTKAIVAGSEGFAVPGESPPIRKLPLRYCRMGDKPPETRCGNENCSELVPGLKPREQGADRQNGTMGASCRTVVFRLPPPAFASMQESVSMTPSQLRWMSSRSLEIH
jgi:hypothetical protein